MLATKLKPAARRQQVLALRAAGLTQVQIATELGLSKATIARDCAEIQESADDAAERLHRLNADIASFITTTQRAEKYAALAISAKNEAVSLGALQRIDDLDGIVTEKERLRAKSTAQPAVQALFVLAPGASIDFGGGSIQASNTTTGCDELPNNGATEIKPNGINDGSAV